MNEAVKIARLEIENLKRVRAVSLEPGADGLTIIGGRNAQGKSSVLDAIAWALGGDRLRPSQPQREGSVLPPEIHITLSNGLLVERKGQNGTLKVTDPTGKKSGQRLLDTFIEQLALNLPRFMSATSKEKADTLLRIIGIGDQLARLDAEESRLYAERLAVGRIADQKKKFADELPFYEGMPAEPISVSELIRQQQDILARNGENARKRSRKVQLQERANLLELRAQQIWTELEAVKQELDIASKDALELHDESTAELEASIANADEINRKVRANLDREKAHDDSQQYTAQYAQLSSQIDAIRTRRMHMLDRADLPLPGLSVRDGALIYKGQQWDNMSGAEQLRVATAIVRKLNPQCGFVLLDGLEQMDVQTLREFGEWLQQEGLQVIGTRVSDGNECSIIIEDGLVVQPEPPVINKTWKAGTF